MKFFLGHVELSRIGGQTSKPTIFLAPGQVSLYVDRSPSIIVFLNSKRQIVCIIKSWRGLLNKLSFCKVKAPRWIKESPKLSPSYFLVGQEPLPQVTAVANRHAQVGSRKPEVSVSTANPVSFQWLLCGPSLSRFPRRL